MNQCLHTKEDMNLLRTPFQIIFSLFLMSSLLQGQGRSIAGDSRKFKLAPVENIKSSIGPTMDGGRLGLVVLLMVSYQTMDGVQHGPYG